MLDLTAEIVPDAGHTLNMEQPEIINARILKFLSSLVGEHEKIYLEKSGVRYEL